MGKKGKHFSLNVKIADSVPSSGWNIFPHFKVGLTNQADTKNSIVKALGQVLHFLKTMKVKNMNKEACKHLECLWDEVQLFGFNLTWLEPYIESALNVEAYMEKAEKVKNLKKHVVDLENELRILKTKLAVGEVVLDIARRDLEEVEKSFEEKDINAEMGYGT
ncbi:hypothetical protein TanjilG_10729 [Lupinus angustifolius]|uniref:MATH domain-containing protein n=1 Tax=Lupinus angustifolius TaxID=3871 RepID=A0A1J7IF12_LUPAN|nr:hypothetical protein TanjilG_10729 [Lupinus angustifolius]